VVKIEITEINNLLKEGKSITQISKSLGLGKDTLRKRLNRQGYKYNKDTNQLENTSSNISNTIISVNSNTTSNTKPKKVEEKEEVEKDFLSREEVQALREIIKTYKTTSSTKSLNKTNRKVVAKSVRTYEDTLVAFARFCKERDILQKDALDEALRAYMDK